jgi:hypothetical protein
MPIKHSHRVAASQPQKLHATNGFRPLRASDSVLRVLLQVEGVRLLRVWGCGGSVDRGILSKLPKILCSFIFEQSAGLNFSHPQIPPIHFVRQREICQSPPLVKFHKLTTQDPRNPAALKLQVHKICKCNQIALSRRPFGLMHRFCKCNLLAITRHLRHLVALNHFFPDFSHFYI